MFLGGEGSAVFLPVIMGSLCDSIRHEYIDESVKKAAVFLGFAQVQAEPILLSPTEGGEGGLRMNTLDWLFEALCLIVIYLHLYCSPAATSHLDL